MLKKFPIILFSTAAALNLACQSVEKTNTSAAARLTNAKASANLSPAMSASPMSAANMTGDADPNAPKAVILPKGATPTPGIPDPKTIGKPVPKGATPTPGIPSEEELRKQMNTPIGNSSFERKPPPVETNSNTVSPITRKRIVRKP